MPEPEQKLGGPFGFADLATAAQAATSLIGQAATMLKAVSQGQYGVRVTLVDSGFQLNLVPGPSAKTSAMAALQDELSKPDPDWET